VGGHRTRCPGRYRHPADAGLEGRPPPGDRLRAINDRTIASAADAEDAAYTVARNTPIYYLVERDGEEMALTVRPNWVGGGAPVYYYLSLVGLTFLGVGVVVWAQGHAGPRAIPFASSARRCFLVLALKSEGQGGWLDWSGYWGDLAGWLLAPALFLHITWALADEDRGSSLRTFRRAAFYVPAVLLFAYNFYLIP